MIKSNLIYTAIIGGVVGALTVLALGMVVPLGAEDQNDATYDTITCKYLRVVRDDGEPAVSISGGFRDSGAILVHGEDDKHGAVSMSGGWTGELQGDSVRFGADLSVSGLQDRINIGGPIGLMVQSTKGDNKRSVVAIHGIHGGIFLNDPEPNRARTIYIGDKYAGGITVEDGKGMTTSGVFGRVNITTKNGGRLELLGETFGDKSRYQVIQVGTDGKLELILE